MDVETVVAHGVRDDRRRGARERGDAQRGLGAARDRLGLGLRGGKLDEDLLGSIDEHLRGRGETHASAPALEQLDPELPLEGAELLRDGGRRERE